MYESQKNYDTYCFTWKFDFDWHSYGIQDRVSWA